MNNIVDLICFIDFFLLLILFYTYSSFYVTIRNFSMLHVNSDSIIRYAMQKVYEKTFGYGTAMQHWLPEEGIMDHFVLCMFIEHTKRANN